VRSCLVWVAGAGGLGTKRRRPCASLVPPRTDSGLRGKQALGPRIQWWPVPAGHRWLALRARVMRRP